MEQSHASNPLSFAVDCERPEFVCNFQGQTSKYKPVNPIIFAYSCSQTLMSEVSNIIETWKSKTSVEVFHGFHARLFHMEQSTRSIQVFESFGKESTIHSRLSESR